MSNLPPISSHALLALLHDLNQPLTAILSNAQAAQRCVSGSMLDRAELADILKDIVADDKRAAAIINTLRLALQAQELRP